MNQKELANELEKWFLSKNDNPNKWNDNPVGLMIRKYLKRWGNYRTAARGNPRKGGYARKAQREERGY